MNQLEEIEKWLEVASLLPGSVPVKAEQVAALVEYVKAVEAIRQSENSRRIPHQGMHARLDAARAALGLK